MKRWMTAALAALASTAALADYTDAPPVFACDAAASRIAIWFEGRDKPFDAPAGPVVGALRAPPSRANGERSPGGSAYRSPGPVRLQRCGHLTLRLRSAYLNANPDGELGVFEFPSVEILDGRHVVLPRTGLAICDLPPSRWQAFGRCPQDFATAVEATAATGATPARVRLARTHNTADGDEVVERSER